MATKSRKSNKKKVGLAVYFTFIATFALCFGAQMWMLDVFNKNEVSTQNGTTYQTEFDASRSNQNANPQFSTDYNDSSNVDTYRPNFEENYSQNSNNLPSYSANNSSSNYAR